MVDFARRQDVQRLVEQRVVFAKSTAVDNLLVLIRDGGPESRVHFFDAVTTRWLLRAGTAKPDELKRALELLVTVLPRSRVVRERTRDRLGALSEGLLAPRSPVRQRFLECLWTWSAAYPDVFERKVDSIRRQYNLKRPRVATDDVDEESTIPHASQVEARAICDRLVEAEAALREIEQCLSLLIQGPETVSGAAKSARNGTSPEDREQNGSGLDRPEGAETVEMEATLFATALEMSRTVELRLSQLRDCSLNQEEGARRDTLSDNLTVAKERLDALRTLCDHEKAYSDDEVEFEEADW